MTETITNSCKMNRLFLIFTYKATFSLQIIHTVPTQAELLSSQHLPLLYITQFTVLLLSSFEMYLILINTT